MQEPAKRLALGPVVRTLLFVLGACLLGACGGASFHDGVYEDEHARYRVGPMQADWARIEVDDNDLAFHKQGMGTISVNSTCTDYEDVPPVALVNHLLFETTERQFLVEETVTLDGRGARHVVAQVELDGVPLELEIFLLKKDGCVFDLTHVRSRSAPAQARTTFVAFVERFAVMETHPDD